MTKIATKTTDTNRAVGRRKCASARVRIGKGNGKITVNDVDYKLYFPYFELQEIVVAPLKALAKDKDLDISAKVVGGGKNGQAKAVQLGIARALVIWNEDFRKSLKTQSFLTRDPRVEDVKEAPKKKTKKK